MCVGTVSVVDDRLNKPAGRKPLSRSSSHSWPSTPVGSVATVPGARLATLVLRQKRMRLYSPGTVMPSLRGKLTVKIVPLSAFSGRPPSAGGLKRGSRQVPVHVGGSAGSIGLLAAVSLYETRVRYGVAEPSML